MDVQDVKELAKELMVAFKEAELTKFSLKCDEFKLELGKEVNVVMSPQITNMGQGVGAFHLSNPTVEPHKQETAIEANNAKEEVGHTLTGNKVIKAPLVGTFYSAEGPNAKPFVEVGSKVKKGDVVCIVEAMKLMNEVEAEEDGEVVEILVDNEDMVEYNQPLIVLR